MARKRTHVEEFSPQRVRPLPNQPRKRFTGIRELADSIQEIGQSTPGIVTPVGDDPSFDVQLVDGERRLRACKLIDVPFRAELRDGAAIEELFAASFAANFGKQDHDAIEIAEALARMQAAGKSVEQIKRIAGKSDCWVYQHISLLKLHPQVQKLMIPENEDGPKLSFALALLLTPLQETKQIAIANRIVKNEGIALPAARRLILRERHKAGDKSAYASRHGARATISGLESILEAASERLGVYLDMPADLLRQLIDAEEAGDNIHLIERIEELTEHLNGLAETIQSRLPKVSAGRTRRS